MSKKPRLKAVQRPHSNDDWQHCCRWCHHYCFSGDVTEGYKCYNKDVMRQMQESGCILDVYSVSENGYAAQTIEEVLNEEPMIIGFMHEIEQLLDKWNISQKRKAEFEKHFRECWSEFADFTLKEKLDEALLKCYVDNLESEDNSNGVSIDNPREFVCQYWE